MEFSNWNYLSVKSHKLFVKYKKVEKLSQISPVGTFPINLSLTGELSWSTFISIFFFLEILQLFTVRKYRDTALQYKISSELPVFRYLTSGCNLETTAIYYQKVNNFRSFQLLKKHKKQLLQTVVHICGCIFVTHKSASAQELHHPLKATTIRKLMFQDFANLQFLFHF